MNSRLYIFALGLLLVAQPALADDEDTMVWDLNIASAVHAAMIRDEKICQSNPYGFYRRGCGEHEPSVDFDEDEGPRLTMLDRVALFVYKYKDLNLDADIRPNTKFKFTMSMANLYEQEAKARSSCASGGDQPACTAASARPNSGLAISRRQRSKRLSA